MAKKNELHSVLAVVDDKKKYASAILQEAIVLFDKKQDHFDGFVKKYEPKEEGGDEIPAETKPLATTVSEKLNYVLKSLASGLNTILEVEETNCSGNAKAELIVDGISMGVFSATSLLAMEREITAVRGVCKEIPTLDPAREWKSDQDADKIGVYKSAVEERIRTVKIEEPVVLYPHTDAHPAQAVLRAKDTPVGKYSTTYFTGKMTPLEKSELLARVDKTLESVKRARAEANSCEVVGVNIAGKLFTYIMG
jgi:hypothetical protein